MINKTKMENEALEYAVGKSGEFIELLMAQGFGSDVFTWTPDAYATFIEEVVTAFVERMQQIKIATDDETETVLDFIGHGTKLARSLNDGDPF